ncbi:31 glycoside hydrolase [Yamadazyma tenuis]|nr:31 glycoside hydrolase [Yamadazyma tenuis]
MWESKEGVLIRWAAEAFKTVVEKDSIYTLAGTRPLDNRGATLNTASISTKITSPAEGVVGFEAYHHLSKYLNSKEPRFELAASKNTTVSATDVDEHTATLAAAGDLTATLAKREFGVEFKSNDRFLTKLGFRSVGWVADSRYPKAAATTNTASTYITTQLHLSVGEKLYGLGERFGPFLKNGQRVEMWNEDGGTSSEWTYKNIPFYLSSKGYGVFVDSPSSVVFELQSERTTRVNITVPGEGARIYIINGPDPKTVLKRYAGLTGFPALPPAWTFGLWLTTSFTTSYDINTVSGFLQGMKDRNIPLRTFHFDSFWMKGFQWCDFEFDADYFPDAKAMLAKLKKDFGIKVCVWINSYIAQESALFKDADAKGYLIKNTDGSSYQTDLWQAGMGIVDFTNPDAWKWYQDKLAALVDIGVDSFKTDFGERIPVKDIKYYDGSDPVAMHNYYTFQYNKCVFEMLEKKLGKNEACLFARSATAGSQQFPVHWGGDCESSFEAMAESLRGGLSLTLSGFGFWSHDIGGFEGSPDPAVYKRWCAFGLMSSHSRLHGSNSYRVPWNFDDEASVVLKKFTDLKISLMPYIFAKAIEAHKEATPVMRAMLLEFPQDDVSLTCDTQFMLGDALLVAPVFNAEGDVSYYVPKGKWYGYLDGEIRDSVDGKYFKETHDFKSMPVLVRPDSAFVTAGPETKIEVPDFAYHEDFMVNVYQLETNQTIPIPDVKKAGEIIATVSIKKTASGFDISTSGKASKTYYVKVLGADVKNAGTKDTLGNTIVKVSGKASIEYV